MIRYICTIVVLTLLVLAPLSEAADDKAAPRLVIGLDLSRSNPLTESTPYARKAAERLGAQIRKLPIRSQIIIRSFGVSDAKLNTIRIDEIVSARNRPDDIAASAELLVANVPELIAKGQLQAQDRTEILAFLKTMHEAIGECRTPTTFILLSDGIEDSEFARLSNPSASLPRIEMRPPKDKRYKCDVLQIWGLGQGLASQTQVDRLRGIWSQWATGDGPFQRFEGLYDW